MAKEVETQAAEVNAAKLKALQATLDKIEKDYGKAFAYWEQSAMMGNTDAQFRVGFCYFYGEGIEENKADGAFYTLESLVNGTVFGFFSSIAGALV